MLEPAFPHGARRLRQRAKPRRKIASATVASARRFGFD
jgi:hypothetical protein